MKQSTYKIDFSIDNLPVLRQQEIYDSLIKMLSFEEKDNLHITVTDLVGGVHHVWEDSGIAPDGYECKSCKHIDCAECLKWRRQNGE